MFRSLARFVLLSSFFSLFAFSVHAQGLGVAEYVQVDQASTLPTGSILTLKQGKYFVSAESYSKDMVGVVSLNPALEFSPTEPKENEVPIVQQGAVGVLVNGEGGEIHQGDLITSSSVAGQGMRAQKSGFILGVAQQDFSPQSPEETAVIAVLLDIRFAFADDAPASERVVSRLMSLVSMNALSFVEEPVKSLKYTAAALSILLSLGLSFFAFGRVANKGVEAIGRNPLAKQSIITGVVINTVLALGLAFLGVVVAYIIVTW